MNHILREPVNTLTHLLGVILAIVGGIMLFQHPASNIMQTLSITIYFLGLLLLYSASSIYHGVKGSTDAIAILRRVDHCMIYVLIASTYTPFCLITLSGTIGYVLMGIIWSMAILGIILKLLWKNAPRKLYTSFYVILGWSALGVIVPLYQALAFPGFLLLVFGGLAYSFGAIIYSRKNEKLSIGSFGFHEIFHLFILLGSILHFICINYYVIN